MWKTAKLFCLLSALLAAMIFFTSCRAEEKHEEVIVPVIVKSGDTLDSIIIRTADQYGDDRDYREIRSQVRRDNGKESSAYIFPGEALNIRLQVKKENAR